MILDTPSPLNQALKIVGRLSRRDFMAFAGAVVGVAAGGAASVAQAQAPALNSINAAEADIFRRVAEVVLPVGGSPLAPWTPEVLLGTLDAALLGTMPPHVLAGLKGGLQYFNEGPVAQHGKRFTALDDATATAFLDAWGNAKEVPHRALASGLKKLVQLSYWANPASWAPLEYDGPISKRNGLKSLGNAPLPTR